MIHKIGGDYIYNLINNYLYLNNMEKYLIIIILAIVLFYLHRYCVQVEVEKFINSNKIKEDFGDVAQSVGGIDDQNAINTLAQVAKKIQEGGLTVPGVLNVQSDGWYRKNPAESDKFAVRVGGMWNGGGIVSAGGSPLELISDNKEVWIGSAHGSAPPNNLTIKGRLNILGPNNQNYHFPFTDGKNYIRGPTQQDGTLNVADTITAPTVNTTKLNANELCLGGVCINADHLRMLKGEKDIGLKNVCVNHWVGKQSGGYIASLSTGSPNDRNNEGATGCGFFRMQHFN
jgi:hypothetical protein